MSDALEESVEAGESLDDAIAAELAALDTDVSDEPSEEVSAEPSSEEPSAEEPVEAPVEEEKLTPHAHWKSEYKDGFSELGRKHQELWMQREREFDNGYRRKSEEANQAKQFVGELQQIIGPVVNDWARQGLQPDAGLRRAIAREQAFRENPQEAIISLAKEFQVDLQQTWAEQPYVDPVTQGLQKKLEEQERQMQEWRQQQETVQRQQLQQAQQTAYQQIVEMTQATDESGQAKYPHVENLMGNMADALTQGRATSLEMAYDIALQELRNHPAIKDVLQRQVQQTSDSRKAEADKAKAASRAVDSNATGTTNQPKTLEQDIMEALEANL